MRGLIYREKERTLLSSCKNTSTLTRHAWQHGLTYMSPNYHRICVERCCHPTYLHRIRKPEEFLSYTRGSSVCPLLAFLPSSPAILIMTHWNSQYNKAAFKFKTPTIPNKLIFLNLLIPHDKLWVATETRGRQWFRNLLKHVYLGSWSLSSRRERRKQIKWRQFR